MKIIRSKILIVEPDVNTRTKICTWLSHEGYAVFECKDVYKTLRLARQIIPDLILVDMNVKGINLRQLIEIIEREHLSKVLLMTDRVNDDFTNMLQMTELKMYIKKPISRKQFTLIVEDTFVTIDTSKKIKAQMERSNSHSEKDELITLAKAIIMEKWHLDDDKAYRFLRKKSMDLSVSIEVVAKSIVDKNK